MKKWKGPKFKENECRPVRKSHETALFPSVATVVGVVFVDPLVSVIDVQMDFPTSDIASQHSY